MPLPLKLLVIDYDTNSAALLVRSLLRQFPQASVHLCEESGTAVQVAATERLDAVVLHRTEDDNAVNLVRLLRKVDSAVPIIVVSGIDRSEQVRAAGATGFLNYEKWLMIGTVVANALNQDAGEKGSTGEGDSASATN